MIVSLISKKGIKKVVLPENIEGSYWIKERTETGEKKIIGIEGSPNGWNVRSNRTSSIVNPQDVIFKDNKMQLIPDRYNSINKIILQNDNPQCVFIEGEEEISILYCTDVYEKNLIHLDIKDHSDILIGKNQDNDISYSQKYVEGRHARLFYEDNTWKIENYDKKYGVFVNDIPVYDKVKDLNSSDVIFIMGLKIILVGDSIYVNNPMDKMRYLMKYLMLRQDKQKVTERDDEDINAINDLYSDKDYFSRSPRIVNKIEREKVVIDNPPAVQSDNQMPAILSMGSSLSMGAVTMVTMYSTFESMNSKNVSFKESLPKLIMCFAMLISMLVIPILIRKWESRQKRKFEIKRQQRYRKYINKKIVTVNDIMDKQRAILNENYISSKECENIVLNKDARIWERKIEDSEFLSVRIGTGDIPLDIDITYPNESFSMEDDDLVEILNSITTQSKILENAPISLSLREKNISSVVSDDDEIKQSYIKNLVMQLVALHSYIDLKLVFLVKDNDDKQWDYLKMLPHMWSSSKQIRFFADDLNDMKYISRYLEEELIDRVEKVGNNNNTDLKTIAPYYLIITDDYKKIESLKIINDVRKSKANLGFSLLCFTDDLTQLPSECKTFITIDEEGCKIFESENSSTTQKEFMLDKYEKFNYPEVSKILANIPIKYATAGSMMLPASYSFLEMYDVGRVEQLNVYDRWLHNDTTNTLTAPIGIDASGMHVYLDVHEKNHGPHGLIAGSTGSGKSEFIITYILSLAVNYHPDDVNFVLIDYKGGGLAGAFEKNGIKLPHLVGTITNIDTIGLQRSLDSIQSELRKRQIEFNKARDLTDESTIDIYKYQKLYHDKVVKKPISHLFIICDEFAELKQQQPEFMDELISVARIGRSLGVHLILATQKPAGIVNDQIRSNSKFGVCLKVQDKSDSTDVIKKPDAAKLKKAGQFYLNVGNDELFVLGQSGWAGAPYIPSDVTKKEVDTSVEFISDIGSTIKKVNNTTKKLENQSIGDQLTSIVEHICNVAKEKNIKEESLWLESIPEDIYVRDLKHKYEHKAKKNIINPIIGEYDDPMNQKQGALSINLSKNGNTIVYGSADSGLEGLLTTMVYEIITSHSPEEVALYLLDFGSETLNMFKKAPQVGDVVLVYDEEKVSRLIEMLKSEIEIRKKALLDYNGDYNLYLQNSGKSMPTMIIFLNNYAVFGENYTKYEEELQSITRECTKYGIIFVITASSYRDIRFRLLQNIKIKVSLQLNNDDDYLYIFEKIGKKRPSNILGRGLIPLEDGGIYEFQTAKICEPSIQNEYVRKVCMKLEEACKTSANRIPTMPDVVEFEHVKNRIKGLDSLPVGIIKRNLGVAVFNFLKNPISVITGKNLDDINDFGKNIASEIKKIEDCDVYEFNTETNSLDFLKMYESLCNNVRNKVKKKQICIIFDLDNFSFKFPNGKIELERFMQNVKQEKNLHVILIDNAIKLKAHQFEQWYKESVPNDTGIWVGNGVDSQFVITTDMNRKEIVSNCGKEWGYTIKQGITTMIKLLGIKKEENEYE